jgi:hypothetical protein
VLHRPIETALLFGNFDSQLRQQCKALIQLARSGRVVSRQPGHTPGFQGNVRVAGYPPGTGQLEFLCLDWSMRASADSALLENSRRDRRTEPIVRTVPLILSAEDQGILGLSRKLEK